MYPHRPQIINIKNLNINKRPVSAVADNLEIRDIESVKITEDRKTELFMLFDPETNLLNFDTLDYVPFFQVPKLIIEQSKDLKNWSRFKLSEPLPKEYQWPKGLSIKLGAELKGTSFFRVKIEE